MSAPLFSVVTISFNQKRFLKHAIESVLAQKSSNVEYIVVDAGSTDGSRDLLRDYAGRIDHLILEPDAGPPDGLNKGFARARGEIGYFLNSDDLLLPGAMERMAAAWSGAQESILLGGGWIIGSEGRPLREVRLNRATATLKGQASGRSVFYQQGMSFRMDAFRRVGGFNAKNRSCWDAELFVDMLIDGACARVLPQRFGAFRIHDESISGGAGGDAMARTYAAERSALADKINARLRATAEDLTLLDRGAFLFDSLARSLLAHADMRLGVFMRQRWRADMCLTEE